MEKVSRTRYCILNCELGQLPIADPGCSGSCVKAVVFFMDENMREFVGDVLI